MPYCTVPVITGRKLLVVKFKITGKLRLSLIETVLFFISFYYTNKHFQSSVRQAPCSRFLAFPVSQLSCAVLGNTDDTRIYRDQNFTLLVSRMPRYFLVPRHYTSGRPFNIHNTLYFRSFVTLESTLRLYCC